jgi:hypothetical protein
MKKLSILVLVLLILGLCFADVFAEEKNPRKVEPGIIVEKGASLVGRRNLVIEPGFQYTHISAYNLDVTGYNVLPALVVGVIQVEKIRRDVLTPSLGIRLGLSKEFDLNLKIPYITRYDSYAYGMPENRVSDDLDEKGLGDIEGGFLVHLIKEKGARPLILAGINIKSRTGKDPYELSPSKKIGEESPGTTIPTELPLGSGHWGIETSLTLVKTADPAVLFAKIGYFDHMKRAHVLYYETNEDKDEKIPVYGTVDPSNSINCSFGFAYALSDKFALSTAYEQKLFSKSKINGRSIPETDTTVASLILGGTYVIADNISLSLSVNIGLTPDSPDVAVGIKLPIRYNF